ncbi:hypothetical protein A3A74_04670 [Candidatus Roizmanbacteria bacterium RIFCSPLOWO2_01_FULL_35_13]|uniref:DUF3828 domain-containing protein n=1 Tax=Candidatus Roizmanbacteria bacterium RIFCSPLOWO2_01_FULL_35_13 TaxID=1802055 RepID=A0A1F7IF33_9BACT|nr:MAG: hypothetical protein A3A74_04670 [Candidatus Roizmanbacteria bacterium RIFCSPLOWO2_01_FULL_35_13]
MDKRIFNIVAGVMVFALIVLIVLVTALNSKKQQVPANLQTQQPPAAIDTGEQTLDLTDNDETLAMNKGTPEEVAKGFYEWYTSTENPLGSGAYKRSPLLSDYFLETLNGFVLTNDHLTGDPVLACVEVRLIKSLAVQSAVYDQSNLKASVVLNDTVTGGASYKVLLSNINSKWLIDDVRCNL